MKMDFQLLKRDFLLYTKTAINLGLPCSASSEKEVEEADEAQLVSLAAEQGWDLGKYVLPGD